ncbi:flagellar hook-associated protein FlgK [Aeromonas simiae]|uniref:Flagellar hook-associated protein 1 n=1 Tax=Aeromonas simiae TaxID=218936 RepID=A0A5J6WWJ8_9GAMM|nr:flagellar hook-associated protein FlgK [Aeromonas simiae]QFI54228.1 flagellar hook-associated protein FlgK [Aeromonas simiae]
MATDLLSIGSSGVLAHQRLLQTTSNNITNVNTAGYVRERTVLSSLVIGMGVDQGVNERILDQYAQGEVRRDTSALAQVTTRYNMLYSTDKLLSDTSNSVGVAMGSYFNALHGANEAPSELTGRNTALGALNNTVDRFHTLADQLNSQTRTINGKLGDTVKTVNGLLGSIDELNQAILRTQNTPEESLTLFDQRDEAIRQLSEHLDIRTVPQTNGSVLVNLVNGQSLVLASGAAKINIIDGDPDPQQTNLQLEFGQNKQRIDTLPLGGTIGGLLQARSDLEPAKRELGQLAVTLGDALNNQNHLGMDLDNQLGGDLLTLPGSDALTYSTNTGSGTASVNFIPGQGANVLPYDYEISFSSSTNYEVFMIDAAGKRTSVTTGATPPSTLTLNNHGIEIDFGGTPAAGDKLLLQPTKQAASAVTSAITRAEDFALASPIKLDKNAQNLGNGEISLVGVSNTGAGSFLTGNALDPNAPQIVKIDAGGNYEVYAQDGTTLIGVAPASSQGQNLMAALENPLGGPKVYATPDTTPGYEFSIKGQVKANDRFTLSYNSNGFSDNRNGLALAELQNKNLVSKGSSTTSDRMTFNQAYSELVVGVGNKVSQSKTAVAAAQAKLDQSTALHESVSGVNLEEEAANLIRFQQAYAASARVVSTAQTIFESLLSAVR